MSYFCKRTKEKKHCSKLFGTIWYFTQLVVQASFIVPVRLDSRASFIHSSSSLGFSCKFHSMSSLCFLHKLHSCSSWKVLWHCQQKFQHLYTSLPQKKVKAQILKVVLCKGHIESLFSFIYNNQATLVVCGHYAKKMAAKKSKHKFLKSWFVKDMLRVATLVVYVHYAEKTPMKS